MADPQDPRFWVPPFRGLVSGRATPGPFEPAPFAVPPEVTPPFVPPARPTPLAPPPERPGLIDPLPPQAPASTRAVTDILRGATVGATGPEDTWWAKGTELLGAALPVVGGAKRALTGARAFLPGTRGLYSRVDEALARIPAKGAHPNKIASLLKSSASQEEIAYRKIPEFLARKGNQTITPAELQAHLTANPAPVPTPITLGPPHDEYSQLVDQFSAKYGEGFDTSVLTPEENRTLIETWNRSQNLPYPRTKYGEHTLAGGENYREHLYTLPPGEEPVLGRVSAQIVSSVGGPEVPPWNAVPQVMSAEQAERLREAMRPHGFDVTITPFMQQRAQYQSSHFDQPNIVVHARSKERTLPLTGVRPLPEIEQIIQDVVGATRPEHIASGGPQAAVRQGLISHDEAALYGQSRGFTNYPHAPTGPRGRFLEEVQSDWHQAGKRGGYRQPTPGPLTPEDVEMRRVGPAPDSAYGGQPYWESYDRRTGTLITRHPGDWPEDVARGEALRIGPRTPEGAVPDAPFKETWPDLALKQQLLDVAHDPALSWLGFTSGKTQADRYDLAKYLGKLEYDPNARLLYGYSKDNPNSIILTETVDPEDFGDYIGTEPAEALRRQITSKQYDEQQWSVGRNEADPDDRSWYVIDPNGELVDPNGAGGWNAREMAERQRRALLEEERRNDLPAISGLDLQVGGEGMTQFYDQLLPTRLNKILAPFGGKVERGAVPTGEGYRILNQEGEQLARYDNLITAQQDLQQLQRLLQNRQLRLVGDEEPAWIARLSPEMKEKIRQGGLPLLAALLGLSSTLTSEPLASPGAPPVASPAPAPPAPPASPPAPLPH